ncbi:MAG: hypothetical protein AAFY72_00580, partial [Cyanobacteria bacterium J06649_4]
DPVFREQVCEKQRQKRNKKKENKMAEEKKKKKMKTKKKNLSSAHCEQIKSLWILTNLSKKL